MSKTLLSTLQEKYGNEYNIEEVEKFHQFNITMIETEDDILVFKLRIKFNDEDEVLETWHTTSDTILNKLLKLEI
jgi:predicted metal-binding protein